MTKRNCRLIVDPQQVVADYQSGFTLRQIACRRYVSHATVANYLRRAGIDRRHEGSRRRRPW